MTTAEKIKALRLSKGLTLRDVATAIGVHFTTVDKLERGIMRPRLEHIEGIAGLFEVSLEQLSAEGSATARAIQPAPFEMTINGIPQPDAIIVNGIRYDRKMCE